MSGSSDRCGGRRSGRRHRGRSRLITGYGFGRDGSGGKRIESKVRTRSGWAGWRKLSVHLVFSSRAGVGRGRGRTGMQVLEGLSEKRRALGRGSRVCGGWFVRFVGGERCHCDLRRSVGLRKQHLEVERMSRCVCVCVDLGEWRDHHAPHALPPSPSDGRGSESHPVQLQ